MAYRSYDGDHSVCILLWIKSDEKMLVYTLDDTQTNTVRCHYNTVNFLQNAHKGHPVAHPLGWDMGCHLWIQTLIKVLHQLLQCCMQYRVTLDLVITALDCILEISQVSEIYMRENEREWETETGRETEGRETELVKYPWKFYESFVKHMAWKVGGV